MPTATLIKWLCEIGITTVLVLADEETKAQEKSSNLPKVISVGINIQA